MPAKAASVVTNWHRGRSICNGKSPLCAAHLRRDPSFRDDLVVRRDLFPLGQSCLTIVAKAAPLIAIGVAPSGSSSAFNSGEAEMALISRFNRSMSGAGVPGGAKIPVQISIE